MSGSTMPITGLLARVAYRPSPDNAFNLKGTFTTWAPVLFLVLLTIGYFSHTLRHIPIADAQSGFKWLKDLLNEPKAPEVTEYQNSTQNGGLMRYKGLVGGDRVLVTSLEGFHEVLQEKSYTFDKWDVTKRVLGPLMGDGLLLQEGDIHKAGKKIVLPSVAPRHIKELNPMFWRKTADMISALSTELDKSNTKEHQLINFSGWAARTTFDILGIATFGADAGMIKNPDSPISKAYGQLFSPNYPSTSIRSTLGIVLPRKLLSALPLARNDVINEANATIRDYYRQCIRRERDMIEAGENLDSLDIISVALRSGKFSDDDLVNQLMTVMVAGYETTAHPLSWAMHHLAQYPDMQTRLRAEIREHLPPLGSGESYEPGNLDELPYLQAVCDEVLRLKPVVPILYRQANEATTVLGRPIPTGTVMALSPWAINRSEKLWGKNADKFNPDRWFAEDNPVKGGKFNKYSFSSFSHGPRQCLGINFARVELSILLAGIIGSFEFKLGDRAPEPNFGMVTVKPGGGVTVRMRKLEGWAA